MRVGTLVLLVFSAVTAAVIASSIASADNHTVYGCFLDDGEVFWDGNVHPAAFGGFGGPGVLSAIVGPDCDKYPSRADYEEKRIWSPEYERTTPTPEPTPTPPPPPPPPTPIPTPVPVTIPDSPWPYNPWCFWNDKQTVLFCYG